MPPLPFKSLNIPKIAYHNRACLLLKRGKVPTITKGKYLHFIIYRQKYVLPRSEFKEAYKKFCPA